jgi:hypothetical protein
VMRAMRKKRIGRYPWATEKREFPSGLHREVVGQTSRPVTSRCMSASPSVLYREAVGQPSPGSRQRTLGHYRSPYDSTPKGLDKHASINPTR